RSSRPVEGSQARRTWAVPSSWLPLAEKRRSRGDVGGLAEFGKSWPVVTSQKVMAALSPAMILLLSGENTNLPQVPLRQRRTSFPVATSQSTRSRFPDLLVATSFPSGENLTQSGPPPTSLI